MSTGLDNPWRGLMATADILPIAASARAGISKMVVQNAIGTTLKLSKQSDPFGQGVVNGPMVVLTGRTSPFATVRLDVGADGTFESQVKANARGSFVLVANVGTGLTTLSAVATSRFGRQSGALTSVYRFDTAIPASFATRKGPTTLAVAPALDPSGHGVVSGPEVVLVGHSSPRSRLTLNAGGVTETTTADAAGNYQFTLNVAPGATFATVDATNARGRHSRANLAVFRVEPVTPPTDHQPPAVTLSGRTTGLLTNHNPTITGQVTDDVSGVASLQEQLDAGAFVPVPLDASGHFSVTTPLPSNGTADGNHTIKFRATDKAGNVSNPVSYSFTLDTKAPNLSVTSPTPGSRLASTLTLTGSVNGTGSNVSSLVYRLDGSAPAAVAFDTAAGTFNQTITTPSLLGASHTLIVTATDAAGNTSSKTIALGGVAAQVVSHTPTSAADQVGVTVRPQVTFSKPINPSSLNSNNFYASFSGQKLPTTIVPANDGSFAWLFFQGQMPSASDVQVTVDGSTIMAADGSGPIDAAGSGSAGSVLNYHFNTVSITPVAGTSLSGTIVDPGPDLLPDTADDSTMNTDGTMTYKLPIAGVKVYILGLENQAVTTDANGHFHFDAVPTGDVKVVIDGKTATSPPTGQYFPEMVMDSQMTVGKDNTVMSGMSAMYLPRIQSSILQTVTDTQPAQITLKPEAALNLTSDQASKLTLNLSPNSLIGPDGQPMASGQVGISVVPPSLVMDMLPAGLLQHTFDITVQAPGVATFATPATMTFPNVFNDPTSPDYAPPGSKLNFLSFDHTTGKLVIEGTATVSADGKNVTTDPGAGVTHPGWHGLTPPGSPKKTKSPDNCNPEDVATAKEDAESLATVLSITSPTGAAFIEHFIGNTGIAFNNPPGVVDEVKNTSDFQAFATQARSYLEVYLQNGGTGTPPLFNRPGGSLTLGTTTFGVPDDLYGAYRGTLATNATFSHIVTSKAGTNSINYSADINFYIHDRYVIEVGKIGDTSFHFMIYLQNCKEAAPFDTDISFTVHVTGTVQANNDRPNFSPLAIQAFTDSVATPPVSEPVSTAIGFGSDPRLYYRYVLANGFEIAGRSDMGGNFDVFLPPNEGYTLYEYSPRYNLSAVTMGTAGPSGTPSNDFIPLTDFGGSDADSDGIPDVGEIAIGSDPNSSNTRGNVLSDSTLLAAGLDPATDHGITSGVLASLALNGEAQAIQLMGSSLAPLGQTAYVATGSAGLAIIDASNFQAPVVKSQLALNGGNATDVAVDPQLNIAAVADGSGGLVLVDVTNPAHPVIKQTISGINATHVIAVDGIVYASVGIDIQAFDMASGTPVQTLSFNGSAITGLARDGLTLYSMDANHVLRVVDISGSAMTAKGSLTLDNGGGSIFAGGGVVYVSAPNLISGGFSTVDVSNPDHPALIAGPGDSQTAKFGTAVVANGSGIALMAGQATIGGTFNGVDVVSLADTSNTYNFITRINLPDAPLSIAIASGIGFVADGASGLQVINYLPFDTKGVAPTVSINSNAADIDPNTPGVQVLEGTTISLSANVSDDVQVRNVELLINGQVVRNNVSFPFDLTTQLPSLASLGAGNTTVTVQVRATDTGGNTTLSDPITLNLVRDTTPPTLVSLTPADGASRPEGARNVTLKFSKPIVVNGALTDVFKIIGAGADGQLGTADDVAVPVTSSQLRDNDTTVQLTTGGFAVGNYEIVFDKSKVNDRPGNSFGTGTFVSHFSVVPFSVSPDFLPFGSSQLTLTDDVEVSIGPMPFAFDFFGQPVSGDMYLTSNAIIEFGTQAVGGKYTNTPLPYSTFKGVAAYWNDLDPRHAAPGSIGYYDGDGVRAITYQAIPYFNRGTTPTATFQIAFYANGTIIIRYGAMGGPPQGGSATIGLTDGTHVVVPSLGNIANQPTLGITDSGGIRNTYGLAKLNQLSGRNNMLVFIPDGNGGYTITFNPTS